MNQNGKLVRSHYVSVISSFECMVPSQSSIVVLISRSSEQLQNKIRETNSFIRQFKCQWIEA